jgi:chromosome segregation ATPase
MTQYELLERELAALRLNLSVTMEELGEMRDRAEKAEAENATLREQLKDCSAVVDRQQEMLDRNAEQIAALREQIKWVLHELKTAADRLTDCQQTTISARDCIGRVEAAMKEEGK